MPNYNPQSDYRTSKGNTAPDFHLQSGESTPTQITQFKNYVETQFNPAKVVRDATASYNCHAFAHANRHAWFNEITKFLEDDYYQFTPGQLRVGDVCVYVKGGELSHSAVITVLAGNTIVELRSKWGQMPEVLHGPTNVPDVYGSIVYYLRKRGTKLIDMDEPTNEDFDNKVDDLLYSLTMEEKITLLKLASTPSVIKTILNEFSEFTELKLYGSIAGQKIIDYIAKSDDESLIILSFAALKIGYTPAIYAIAEKIIATKSTNFIDFKTAVLFEIFNSLKEKIQSEKPSDLNNIFNEVESFLKSNK
jgi:hypothetical protein